MKGTARRLALSSSDEEMDFEPEVQPNPFEKSPILICKNVDFMDFIIEALAFHIEECFTNMGWVSVETIENTPIHAL